MSDSINLRLLDPSTYSALGQLHSARGWRDWTAYSEPEHVAWLCFRLEQEPDSEGVFPKGKWATIQRLQDMVRNAAAEDWARA